MQKKINIELTQDELNALKKALFFLKFECDDTGSLLYSGSNFINSALEKLIKNDVMYDQSKSIIGNSGERYKDIIVNKIRELDKEEGIDEGRIISEKEINTYMYPFCVRD